MLKLSFSYGLKGITKKQFILAYCSPLKSECQALTITYEKIKKEIHHILAKQLFYKCIKPWPNGLASRRKFAKVELAYKLAKGGQTDSQVGSQVVKSRTFHAYDWLMRFYN